MFETQSEFSKTESEFSRQSHNAFGDKFGQQTVFKPKKRKVVETVAEPKQVPQAVQEPNKQKRQGGMIGQDADFSEFN